MAEIEPACEAEWRDCMVSNWSGLVINIDTEIGNLRGHLLANETLPRMTLSRIWDTKDRSKRLNNLLDAIKKGDYKRFQSFCKALVDDGQRRIVDDFLSRINRRDCTDRIEPRVCDPLEKPLPEYVKSALCRNWVNLLDTMACDDDLLMHLESIGVFVPYQRQIFSQVDEQIKRNEMVLNALLKCSVRKFILFRQTLEANNQAHVFANIPSAVPSTAVPPNDSNMSRPQTQQSPTQPHVPTYGRPSQESGRQETAQTPSVETTVTFTIPPTDFSDKVRQEIAAEVAYNIRYEPANKPVTRGCALIISNKKFTQGCISDRDGTDADVKSLQELLGHRLNFKVIVHRDLTAEGILNTCKDFSVKLNAATTSARAAKDAIGETDAVCETTCTVLAVCILSHGKEGVVLGTDGKEVSIEKLTTTFDGNNCKALVGKPKLFFIQACQGDEKTAGVATPDSVPHSGCKDTPDAVTDGLGSMTLNEKSDIAVILATYPGQVAWRNTTYGSYFIQALVEVFAECAHQEDFLSIMTKVTARTNKYEIRPEKYKQICQTRSTLQKKVYLLPY